MNRMRAGANRRSEYRPSRIVRVERLNHPNAPETIDSVRTIDVFAAGRRIEHILAAAGEIERATKVSDGRSAVPNNVHAAVIAGTDPGENIVVQNALGRTGSINLDWRRP